MRKAAGSPPRRTYRVPAWRLFGALALALSATACVSDGKTSLVIGRAATVAFESIDGPPQPVFQKLVENLASEAVARQVSVISREANPNYRVRGYMAAHVEKRRIHIGWVWDVYDVNKHRVLRIADEELGSGSAADAWSAADDAMLRRIARSGMDRIATWLGGSGAAPFPAQPPAGADGIAVAAAENGALAAALALADTRP